MYIKSSMVPAIDLMGTQKQLFKVVGEHCSLKTGGHLHKCVDLTQPAVVLMAPDDKVEEVRNEGLGNVVGGTPLGTILQTKNDQPLSTRRSKKDQPLLSMTGGVKKDQPLSTMTGGVKKTSLFYQ